MTLYATLPPLSLFLSFYCSRNFEACELNLFLSTQLSKSPREVSKFASVALVDIDFDEIQVYVMRETQEDYYLVLFTFVSQLYFYVLGPISLLGY